MTESFDATVLLRSEQTAGAVSAVALTVPAGWAGPPLHHHAFDEAFYVLEGELTFQLGDELATAGPNTLVFAPGGSVHTLANLSAARARYLLLCTPAGFERRFEGSEPVPETIVVGSTIADGEHAPARPVPQVPRGINVLVRGEEAEGRIAVMDNSVDPAFAGPPLHHHDFDELFCVVEGELTFQVGAEVVTRRPGELAFAPRGEHHTWANHSGAPARTLIICTPAGFEPYFGRMAAERAGVEPPEWAMRDVPPTTVVGPPIAR
jgi:mannose-6-phosphate isomerase-like protein (cupin superfamily)